MLAEFEIRDMEMFVVLGIAMFAVSLPLHETGHVVSCAVQEFEIIEVNILDSYVVCSEQNQLVWVSGGGIASLAMIICVCSKRIRNFLPCLLGIQSAILVQFVNMIVEGFFNYIYKIHQLEYVMIAVLAAVMILFLAYYRSRLNGAYTITATCWSLSKSKRKNINCGSF